MKQYDKEIDILIQQATDNRMTNPKLTMEAARTLRDIAKNNDDEDLLGFADYSMTSAYFVLNDADGVQHYAERALDHLIPTENWELAGNCYNLMALAQVRTGDLIKAMDLLATAAKYAEKYHLEYLGAVVYMNFADIYIQLESFEEALNNIVIAETHLDHCKEEDKQQYYYTIACSEAAYYAKRTNDLELYRRQREMLNHLLSLHPEYGNDINLLFLKYQEAVDCKDAIQEEELIEEIRKELFTTMEFLNYTNECMSFLEILRNAKKYHILDELLELIEQNLNGFETVGIATLVSAFKIKYYKETEQKEKLDQELYAYYQHMESNQIRSNETMISLMNTRRNLEVSERTNQRLKELSETDSLTGLPNRRALNMKLDKIFELAYHKKHYLGLEMLDVDNFKSVNDLYGHSTGDDVLVLLGKCLKEICNEQIYAARYGGDEFVVIFDEIEDKDIYKINDHLKELINIEQ